MTAPSIKEALELLPCPFCGGEAERIDIPTVGSDPELGGDPNAGGSCIQCKQCTASTALHFDRKENLYSSWNDRAALATLQPSGERREAIAWALSEKWPGDYMQGDDECEREPNALAYETADAAILASGVVRDEAGWRDISTAPRDGTAIFVRRDNGCSTDYMVVCWNDMHNDGYPWRSDNNAYVEDRWDEWMLPPIRSASNGGGS